MPLTDKTERDAPAVAGAPTVYVVEDDPANRDLFDELCTMVGLRIKTYSNARQFLADPPPVGLGCIVLDIRMPGMSGLELQSELTKRGIELPIIFVTAHGETNLAVRAMKEGAFDFIEKPFDNDSMMRCIRNALSRAEEVAEDAARRAEIQYRLNRLIDRLKDTD